MTSKGGWDDRSDVSCPAYGFLDGFRCGIREQSGKEGYSSGNKQLPSYQADLGYQADHREFEDADGARAVYEDATRHVAQRGFRLGCSRRACLPACLASIQRPRGARRPRGAS